jgi:hypothetical protein
MDRGLNMLFSALVFLAAVLGFAYGATFSNGCGQSSDAKLGCVEFVLFRYHWEIFRAGTIAAAPSAFTQRH